MSDTLTGKTIGKYKITERLGKGGMAEVYKGYHEGLDRYVAVKIMHTFLISEEDFLQRFQREARAMASLDHPNIVRVHDFDVYGENSYYLIMQYIDGGTLKEKLEALAKNDERLPLEDAVEVAVQVANALSYAHRRNMIHRDIKPANIMLDGESEKAILTDFGIVKLVGSQAMNYTATGALIGTPAYMSPEQALGKPGDERVDIYALGVLLFQMVTTQLPFEAETPLAVVMKHVNELPPLPMTFNPDVPLDLQEIILKALAKNPDDRYRSANEFASALRAVDLSGVKASAGVMPTTTPSSPTLSAAQASLSTAAGQTAVSPADEITDTAETAVAASPPKKRPPWLYAGIGLLAVVLVAAILAVSGVFSGNTATPTATAVAVVDDIDTPTALPLPEASEEAPTAGPTPLDPVDAARTAVAESEQTREADATSTPSRTPTATKTPTPLPTVDATAEFMSTCAIDAEIVNVERAGQSSNYVPIDFRFDLEWTLRNSGSCPWPADLGWRYESGDDLGEYDEPVLIGTELLAGEEVVIKTRLGPVDRVGDYESAWQLVDADGAPYSDPLSFTIIGFEVATAAPTATATSAAPPTVVASGELKYAQTIGSCDYTNGDQDWRCLVTITPYIEGSDIVGSYTIYFFDGPGGTAVEDRGKFVFTHFVQARRCAAYNQEMRIIDDVTGGDLSVSLYIAAPSDCTVP
ncbi:MAG: protein kinase [Chloroflexi bacterium]|nr:protein kinase [Chloroflexota bacterium]